MSQRQKPGARHVSDTIDEESEYSEMHRAGNNDE